MTFREIDDALLELVDAETGEVLNYEAFANLQMERDKKAENMALWVMDLEDETAALKKEIERLQDRKKAAENKAKNLKKYLQYVLRGEQLKSDTLTISFRNSEAVDILDDETVVKWAKDQNLGDKLLKYKEPEVSKTAVKELIKAGTNVPGAMLVNNVSTIIK